MQPAGRVRVWVTESVRACVRVREKEKERDSPPPRLNRPVCVRVCVCARGRAQMHPRHTKKVALFVRAPLKMMPAQAPDQWRARWFVRVCVILFAFENRGGVKYGGR